MQTRAPFLFLLPQSCIRSPRPVVSRIIYGFWRCSQSFIQAKTSGAFVFPAYVCNFVERGASCCGAATFPNRTAAEANGDPDVSGDAVGSELCWNFSDAQGRGPRRFEEFACADVAHQLSAAMVLRVANSAGDSARRPALPESICVANLCAEPLLAWRDLRPAGRVP